MALFDLFVQWLCSKLPYGKLPSLQSMAQYASGGELLIEPSDDG